MQVQAINKCKQLTVIFGFMSQFDWYNGHIPTEVKQKVIRFIRVYRYFGYCAGCALSQGLCKFIKMN